MSLCFEFQEQLRAIEESIQANQAENMGLSSEINDLQDEVREGYVPEKKPAPDYGEPWQFQFIPRLETPGGNCLDRDFNVTVMHRPERSSERIVACVNACAGMSDPSAEIQAMREALAACAINTNIRLFDLVRYMRSELHEEELITDEEYTWLCGGADMANSPQGGSPSPRRLEDYDTMRNRLHHLTWTPVTERLPTIEDANEFEDVEWSDGKDIWQNSFYLPNSSQHKATHWRRITLP